MRGLLLVLVSNLLITGCVAADVASSPEAPGSAEAPASTPSTSAPPTVDVRLTHDHRDAPRTETFTIPAGHTPLVVDIGFRAPDDAPACAASDARMHIQDPSGGSFVDMSASLIQTGCSIQGRASNGQTLQPGTYTVRWEGQGVIQSYVTIVS